MLLFSNKSNSSNLSNNLLSCGGSVYYCDQILEKSLADIYFEILLKNPNWESDRALIYGKTIYTKRQIIWVADQKDDSITTKNGDNLENQNSKNILTKAENLPFQKIQKVAAATQTFTYSGITRVSGPWTPEILKLKQIVENICKFRFNSCLLNLYLTGNEGMAWHTDKTKEFGSNTTIATLSLGVERRFDLKNIQTKEKISILLEHSSLLIMTGETQNNWLHQIPKTTKILKPRISLTFRQLLMI